jgi:hypothetical protein
LKIRSQNFQHFRQIFSKRSSLVEDGRVGARPPAGNDVTEAPGRSGNELETDLRRGVLLRRPGISVIKLFTAVNYDFL